MLSTIKQLAHPVRFFEQLKINASRASTELFLASFSDGGEPIINGPVLVEATWDNPNYWVRFALLRKALGLSFTGEVGYIDSSKNPKCKTAFQRFGINEIYDLVDFKSDINPFLNQAAEFLSKTTTPGDILSWKLPYDFPASFLYDGILKRQRSAVVDLSDSRLKEYVADALACIHAADKITSLKDFKLVLVTHVINFKYGAVAWVAMKKNIPVVLMFGNYGVPRFIKMITPTDIYNSVDRPRPEDVSALTPEQSKMFIEFGQTYLGLRISGKTDDIGSEYAFQKADESVTKTSICSQFNWDPTKPVVGVYASNWFDYPHAIGMSHFRDFLDWVEQTMNVARKNTSVNWLFKAHPCDQWYGGITLKDIVSTSEPAHIKLAPVGWNGKAMMASIDAIVTYHGTVGIEFAAQGKPVLLSDIGWYHDMGIGLLPHNRQAYLNELECDWWSKIDVDHARHAALLFSGIYFGYPDWQGRFLTEDDSKMDVLWPRLPGLIKENPHAVESEISHLRAWFQSKHPYYHTYKMLQASRLK
jgi:hypothetical protein